MMPGRKHSMPMDDMGEDDGSAVDALLSEFREYLKGKRKERLSAFAPRKAESEEMPDDGDGPDSAMDDQCRSGDCDHPEHWKDDLDSLLE